MENKTNNSKGGMIIGIIFIIWFIASIGGLIYCNSNGLEALSVGIFGQYFLIFGIFIIVSEIKKKKFNPIMLLFPLIGIGAIAGALVYQFGNEEQVERLINLLPCSILLIFFLIGVRVLVYAFQISILKRQRCTYPIDAVCIGIKTRFRHKEGRSYCPVYMIEYQGKVIELCDEIYSNTNKLKPGDTKRIMINPNNPQDFHEPGQTLVLSIFSLIFGLIFMGTPILFIYMFLQNM